ncbi:MAG TPA: DUF4209 domain-containing protein [Flavipsychrobacter sp.]|nr:DUF4209 domain-containing protein [Flavipsychrobacter sp.]
MRKPYDGYSLAIPQFGEAIRNLVEVIGGNVMVQKGDAFNRKTINHLLSDGIVVDIVREGKSLYFRTLFTDKCGWKNRNDAAHGCRVLNSFS